MSKIVTRFAPSPTGFMHIGGVRTALFAWLLARKYGGTFILRIEDTDKAREVEGSIDHIQECLRWCGLAWDYGPDKPGDFGSTIQSERLDTYREVATRLYEQGLAYPDPFTKEELQSMRAIAQDEKRAFLVREYRPATLGAWDGKTALRFKQPPVERSTWVDAVRGELSAGPEALDDFIILKADGYPTYNLAHIVDDMNMGVTHIFRSDEFISSMSNYIALYKALNITSPVFVTLPPILREDRLKKLGKRDGAKDLLEYRTEGYLPQAMVNYLAFIGWNPGGTQEIFSTLDELAAAFDISGIQTHGGIANEEKLCWFNREYVQNILTGAELVAYLEPSLKRGVESRGLPYDSAPLTAMLPLLRSSVTLSSELEAAAAGGDYDYIFADPTLDPHLIAEKKSNPTEALQHLEHIASTIAATEPWTMQSLKDLLWAYATEHGRGAVLWPLRYALTGREKSADPFTVAEIVGRGVVMRRVFVAINLLKNL